jgi:putative N-acetyltransferase (TIGR04045 family)
MDRIVCKIAETADEYREYLSVRHAIFVEEQGLFHGTDVDEHDRDAIPIIAVDTQTGTVAGAVRCYPASDNIWYGGRLAVLQPYRHSAASIGANLCRVAEATVIAHGCRQFLAYIQSQNVRFFQRLGWREIGEPVIHHGQPHQLMQASLAAAHASPAIDRRPLELATDA